MKLQELPARAYLAHLRRHPVPELMDEECVAALANVEAQFGDTITHGAGLEVRLGNPARFVDYVMCVDQDRIPSIQCIWYEIDYADFLRGGEIAPCLFINTSDYKQEETDIQDQGVAEESGTQRRNTYLADAKAKEFWDRVLPPFAGEKRAARLREQLDRVIALLPPDATVKQIGTMSPRGELDILRLVVIFHQWDNLFVWLREAGWPGDTQAMEQALRSMSPGIIICDEIGSEQDVRAVRQCVNSGVRLIATAHARSKDELLSRPALKRILSTGAFSTLIFLRGRERAGEVAKVFREGKSVAA